MIATVFFYLLAAMGLYSAYFVVTARNLFHSTLGLIAVLLAVAGMYLLMDAQFLSAVQVTVYIGGIVVLIVFVILLVQDVTQKQFETSPRRRKALAGLAVAALFPLLSGVMLAHGFHKHATATQAKSASIHEIGQALLSSGNGGYVLPFETISLILIGALIGAVTIARLSEAVQETPEKKS